MFFSELVQPGIVEWKLVDGDEGQTGLVDPGLGGTAAEGISASQRAGDGVEVQTGLTVRPQWD